MPQGSNPQERPKEVEVVNKPSAPIPVTNTKDHSNLKVDAHITNWSGDTVNVYAKAQQWDYRLVASTNIEELKAVGAEKWEAVCLVADGRILCKKPLPI
jgi:hypothetical protein